MCLKKHLRTHENAKPFECSVCNKKFSYKSGLKDHVSLVHDGGGRLQCSYCQMKFMRESQLKIHVRVHTNESHFNALFVTRSLNEKTI